MKAESADSLILLLIRCLSEGDQLFKLPRTVLVLALKFCILGNSSVLAKEAVGHSSLTSKAVTRSQCVVPQEEPGFLFWLVSWKQMSLIEFTSVFCSLLRRRRPGIVKVVGNLEKPGPECMVQQQFE